jgi:hypothetical protein
MKTDAEIIEEIVLAYAVHERPEHFTNFEHCEECADHDELLRSRDLSTLTLEDVGNPGWDPICFITPEGFAYYLPALFRLALRSSPEVGTWYVPQLLFLLCSDGSDNARVRRCSPKERGMVADCLRHIRDTRKDALKAFDCENQLSEALRYWSHDEKA